jgi:hypothetical protein
MPHNLCDTRHGSPHPSRRGAACQDGRVLADLSRHSKPCGHLAHQASIAWARPGQEHDGPGGPPCWQHSPCVPSAGARALGAAPAARLASSGRVSGVVCANTQACSRCVSSWWQTATVSPPTATRKSVRGGAARARTTSWPAMGGAPRTASPAMGPACTASHCLTNPWGSPPPHGGHPSPGHSGLPPLSGRSSAPLSESMLLDRRTGLDIHRWAPDGLAGRKSAAPLGLSRQPGHPSLAAPTPQRPRRSRARQLEPGKDDIERR